MLPRKKEILHVYEYIVGSSSVICLHKTHFVSVKADPETNICWKCTCNSYQQVHSITIYLLTKEIYEIPKSRVILAQYLVEESFVDIDNRCVPNNSHINPYIYIITEVKFIKFFRILIMLMLNFIRNVSSILK